MVNEVSRGRVDKRMTSPPSAVHRPTSFGSSLRSFSSRRRPPPAPEDVGGECKEPTRGGETRREACTEDRKELT